MTIIRRGKGRTHFLGRKRFKRTGRGVAYTANMPLFRIETAEESKRTLAEYSKRRQMLKLEVY